MAQEKVLDIIKSRKIIESAYGINLNAAQGTAANSLTRRDFVEAQDALKVSKSGDTMSGNLTVPKVLLSAAQGAEANSVARRDFVESTVDASGKGVKDLTIALPAGAPATGYIPVMFRTNGTSDSFVFIDTLRSGSAHPMNNCSFLGNVRASGLTDRGSYAVGQFTIFSESERAIHSIHRPTEVINGYVVYVETRAFPITVRVDIGTTVTAHATDVTYGTSVFKVDGQVSGNTKTIVLANFDKGTGTYNGSNRVYDNGYNPTPEAVGALPVNGNAVTASRLQTARLIAGVPFDGTSNISISATNVGALPITGGTLTGGLVVNANVNAGGLFSTGSITANTTASYSGLRLSSNSTGYSEIVPRRAGEADFIWTNGIRYYNSGNYWAIGVNKIYHEGFKPTATDVGAVSKAGDTMSGSLEVRTKVVLRDANGIAKATFGIGSDRDIFINNVTSDKYLQLKDDGSLQYSNNRIYHEGNKPTPEDVGAVSKAGDTMTGGLTINRNDSHINFGIADGTRKWHLETLPGSRLRVVESDVAVHTEFIPGGDLKVKGNLFSGSSKVYHEGFKPTPGDVGAVNKTGDTMTGALTAPEFIESSDIRLKSDIRTIDRCLDRVNVITPYTYDKVGQDGYDAGVIAQDVAYALPEAVRDIKVEVEGEEKEMLGVSYSGLTALAIGAIKELHELVKAQQAEITELKSLIK